MANSFLMIPTWDLDLHEEDHTTIKQTEKKLKKNKNKKIVIFDSLEHESLWSFEFKRTYHNYIKNLTENNDLFIEYWTSSLEFPEYTFFDDINIKLINWKLSWAFFSYYSFNHNYIDYDTDIKNLYICMNNRSYTHRCVFIDTIFKKQSENLGVLSWNTPDDDDACDYPFIFFDNRRIDIDNFGLNERGIQENVPFEYVNSLFDIVTESDHCIRCLTEKTFRPIIYKKPFLIYGANGINKKLEELGFKLFHNLFDYSFDDVNSMIIKSESIIDQITQYKDYNYNNLNDKCKHITEYNYNKLLEILDDSKSIPREFWEKETLESLKAKNPVYKSISQYFNND